MVVILIGALAVGRPSKPRTEPAPDSAFRFVAVLPLNDVSADGSLENLGEGFARTIIDDLSQNPELRLIAYESSSRFRGNAASVQSIARQLGADMLVTGTIDHSRSGDTINVAIRMTDAETGKTAWTRSISIPGQRPYLAHSRLGEAVMSAFRDREDVPPAATSSPPRLLDNRAYDLYLQARRKISAGTRQSLMDALELLELARQTETGFGRAHALQLDAKSRLYLSFSETWPPGQIQDIEDALIYKQELLRDAEHLVTQHPALADSHLLLGRMLRVSRRFVEARRALERSLELNPSMGEAHRELGWLNHNTHGSWAQTAAHFRQAVALDPYALELRAVLVAGLTRIANANEEMWQVLSDTKQRLPWSPRISLSESMALVSEGRYADAIQVLEGALDRGEDPRIRTSLAGKWYALDRTDRARQLEPDYESWRDSDDPQSLDPLNRCPADAGSVGKELIHWAAYVCAERRRPQRVRALLEARYPTPRAMNLGSDTMLGTDSSVAVLMAWALEATGDARSAEDFLQIEERAVNGRTEDGDLESSEYFMLKARLAAVRGNAAEVFEYLDAMLELGQIDPRAIGQPVFDRYRPLPKFQELLQKRTELVQAQLAQLGLAESEQFAAAEIQ